MQALLKLKSLKFHMYYKMINYLAFLIAKFWLPLSRSVTGVPPTILEVISFDELLFWSAKNEENVDIYLENSSVLILFEFLF